MFRILIILVTLTFTQITFSQDVLSPDEAVRITLENNYGIQLAKNAVDVARNNTSKFNTGEMPTLRLQSGANYGAAGSEIAYHNDNTPAQSTWLANGVDLNAGLSANYLIYDFEGRKLRKKKLKEDLSLSELNERKSVELNVLSTLISYYNIAQMRENLEAQKEVLAISRERKERVNYQFQYGKNNRLAVLNAEVDINRDSIDLLNLKQQLENEKRDMNLLLGRDVDTPFLIDTSLTFQSSLLLDNLLAEAQRKNIDLLLLEKDQSLTQLDISINETALKPQLSANSSLGVFGGLNDNKSLVKSQFVTDFSAGLSLSWNIFDGGYTKVRQDNLKIALDNIDILRRQQEEEIIRDLKNAWDSYQNQLFIMQVEKSNIETAQINFERTAEQFKLGQVSSVEFRQAQLNKLYAQLNFNRAKFIAKINELRLLQLSGGLVE